MTKYIKQKNRQFDERECTLRLHYYDNMICVALEGMTMRTATDIGRELVGQMVCRSFEVDWDGETDLWLTDVDYAILNGFGTENGLNGLLAELCEAHGYKAACAG